MYISVVNIKWDIVIDFRSSVISYLLYTKQRYVFKKKRNLNHLDQLKFFFSIDDMLLSISNNKNEEDEANKLMVDGCKYIVLFPGGNWKPKIWRPEYFNRLAHMINNNCTNIKFIIVGSLEEKKIYFEKIKKDLPLNTIIDLMGKSLTATSAYMVKSDLFIGNDSGLMHLSVASNLKTIALFGPTNDRIYGHYNSNSFVIRTKERYESFNRNTIDSSKTYMDSIKPEAVFDFISKNNLL